MAKVFVNIVTWNSMKYLPMLMASLREQTFRDFSILVIDNASTDGMIECLRASYPEATILRNFKNLGFASAHNQGIKYALAAWRDAPHHDRYVLVTNPDIVMTPTFLERVVQCADREGDVAAFGGKLLKMTREGEGPFEESVRSTTIDSTGIELTKSRRTAERGAGEEDRGQYDTEKDVFGISGGLALYRASALEEIRYGDSYFDDAFFAYKEDVDLAWRLRLAGASARFVPEAIAYHFRTASGRQKAHPFEMLWNRKTKSDMINFYSYRNHLLMLTKNEHMANAFRHALAIFGYELAKFFAILIFEPKTLRGVIAFWREVPSALAKRKAIMANARVSAKDMRRWFQ